MFEVMRKYGITMIYGIPSGIIAGGTVGMSGLQITPGTVSRGNTTWWLLGEFKETLITSHVHPLAPFGFKYKISENRYK